MTYKINKSHFAGSGKVFSREKDGLAGLLRLIAAEIVKNKVRYAVEADEIDLADLEFTDNSTGDAYTFIEDFALPKAPHTASGSTGVAVAALDTANGVALNALSVLVKNLDLLRVVIGVTRLDADGTVAAPGVIPAVTKSVTAATGTAAADFDSAVVALKDVKEKVRKTVDYLNATLEALGLEPLRSELKSDLYEGDLAVAPSASAAGTGGVNAASKEEVDAFFAAVADVIATIADHWNAQIGAYDPDVALVTA